MKNLLFLPLFLPMLFLSIVSAEAANHYIRSGASGTGNGNDWTNTYTTIPATLIRGDTYYVADGSYGDYTFDDATSGTTPITIKKATVADHGTQTGWSDTFGDGQASFGNFIFKTSYYVIDGQTRDESNWDNGTAYGIHFRSFSDSYQNGSLASHLTIRYVDAGGPDGVICTYTPTEQCPASIDDLDVFYFNGNGVDINDITVSRFRAHNMGLAFQLAGTTNVLIEYGLMIHGWNKEVIRGGNQYTNNTIIRYNSMIDTCKGQPGVAGASGRCTAQIAMWSSQVDGNEVYGNLIFNRANYPGELSGSVENSNGCIFIGTNSPGPVANNTKIYNNTMVGIGGISCQVGSIGGTNNQSYNNIWYKVTAATGCLGGTCSNNSVIALGSQFINALTTYPATGFNFRLASATAAGTTLLAPYNQDMNAVKRGVDGVWDLGAFEFGGGGGDITPPAAPVNIRIQ